MGVCAGKETASRPDAGDQSPGALRGEENPAPARALPTSRRPPPRRSTAALPRRSPGLRLVEGVLDAAAHDRVVVWIRATLDAGRAGALPGNTYAPIPDKWRARNQSREAVPVRHLHPLQPRGDPRPRRAHAPELDAVVDALVPRRRRRPRSPPGLVHRQRAARPGQWIPPRQPRVRATLRHRLALFPTNPRRSAAHGVARGRRPRARARRPKRRRTRRDASRGLSARPRRRRPTMCRRRAPVAANAPDSHLRRVASPDDPRAAARAKPPRRRARRDAPATGSSATPDRWVPRARSDAPVRAPETERRGTASVRRRRTAAATARLTAGRAARADAHVSKPREKRGEEGGARVAKAAPRPRGGGDAAEPRNRIDDDDARRQMASQNWNDEATESHDGPPCPRELLPLDAQEEKHVDVPWMSRPSRRALARAPERCLAWRAWGRSGEVRKTAVARQWHGTRYRAWSGVEDFARRCVTDGSLVADVGCGNGKNAPIVASRGGFAVGCDFSAGLLDICAEERGLEVFAADATCLPVRSGTFDVALNIAVLHRVSSHRRRVALVSATMRLLRVGRDGAVLREALEQGSAASAAAIVFDAHRVGAVSQAPRRGSRGRAARAPKGPKGGEGPDAERFGDGSLEGRGGRGGGREGVPPPARVPLGGAAARSAPEGLGARRSDVLRLWELVRGGDADGVSERRGTAPGRGARSAVARVRGSPAGRRGSDPRPPSSRARPVTANVVSSARLIGAPGYRSVTSAISPMGSSPPTPRVTEDRH